MIGVHARGLLAVLLLAGGCGCGSANQNVTTTPDGRVVESAPDATANEADAVPTPTIILGSPPTRVRVTLARTAAEREHGLMGVQNLAMDDGMFFIFENERDRDFWMKNTLIPLDIIFIRADWTVAGIVANAVPLSEEPRGVDRPSKYVLEVNGGWAAAHGVTNDSTVTYESFTP